VRNEFKPTDWSIYFKVNGYKESMEVANTKKGYDNSRDVMVYNYKSDKKELLKIDQTNKSASESNYTAPKTVESDAFEPASSLFTENGTLETQQTNKKYTSCSKKENRTRKTKNDTDEKKSPRKIIDLYSQDYLKVIDQQILDGKRYLHSNDKETKGSALESKCSRPTTIESDTLEPTSSVLTETCTLETEHTNKKDTSYTKNGNKISKLKIDADEKKSPLKINDSFSQEYRKIILKQIREGKSYRYYSKDDILKLRNKTDNFERHNTSHIEFTSKMKQDTEEMSIKHKKTSNTLLENSNRNNNDTFSEDTNKQKKNTTRSTKTRMGGSQSTSKAGSTVTSRTEFTKTSNAVSAKSSTAEARNTSKEGSRGNAYEANTNTQSSIYTENFSYSDDTFNGEEYDRKMKNGKSSRNTSKGGSHEVNKTNSTKSSKGESRNKGKAASEGANGSENSRRSSERDSSSTACQRVFIKEGDEFKCVDEELEQMLEESTQKSRKSSKSTEEGECPGCDTCNDEVKDIATILQSIHRPKKELCVGALPAVLGDFLWGQESSGSDKGSNKDSSGSDKGNSRRDSSRPDKGNRKKDSSGTNRGNRKKDSSGYENGSSKNDSSGYENESNKAEPLGYENGSSRKETSGYEKSSSKKETSGYGKGSSKKETSDYEKGSDKKETSGYEKETSKKEPSGYEKSSDKKEPSGYEKGSGKKEPSGYEKGSGKKKP